MESTKKADQNTHLHPWLSVIIPIYNAEKFLRQCLNSILAQSCTDFEVILVDDGSTDSSGEICLEYAQKDQRLRYLKKENGGPFRARIYGAERSCGTYFTFCDADDYYLTADAFAILHRELKEGTCSVLQFGHVKKYNHLKRRVSAVSQTLDMDGSQFMAQEYPKLLCSFWEDAHISNTVWNKVYHRKLLASLPGSDSADRIFWGEDLILNLHLLENCDSVRYIPDYLYGYRQLYGGTSKFSLHTMEDLDRIKHYQLAFLKRYPGTETGKIQQMLFTEIAGWFFVYIQQDLDHLTEPELSKHITDTLCLSSFVQARQYFLDNPGNDWDAIQLLRQADPDKYIEKAKQAKGKQLIKKKILDILKYLYSIL